jgi:type II secretory pathway component PulC
VKPNWLGRLQDPWILTAAVVLVGLSVTAVQLFLTWRALSQTPDAAPVAAPATTERREFRLRPVLEARLFGETTPEQAGQAAVPETSQNLVLRGAFVSALRASAGAIIESADGQARWYRVGSALPGGAVLDEVLQDHVLLRVGSRRETLRFPRGAEASAGAAAPMARPAADVARETRVDEPIADLPPEEKARIVRARLEELRNRSRR